MKTTRRRFLKTAATAAGATAAAQDLAHAQDRDPDHQAVPSDLTLRVKSLESLLVEKDIVDRAALDVLVDTYEHKIGPRNGAPLYEGRTFERRDHEEKTGAVIISRSVAEKYWPGKSAFGKRLVPGLPEGNRRWYTVVGVVGDVHYDALEKAENPAIYYTLVGLGGGYDDWSLRRMTVVVRAATPPQTLSSAIREKVWSLDRNLPFIGVHTGGELLSLSMARTSYTMMLLAIAAGVALFLGTIGIYGVISYIVGQRTREIGVRIALGAARSDVSRLVVSQGLTMTLLGVGLGVLGTLAATRLMSALLFGVSAVDPGTFVTVALFLVGVATLASYIPARRAAGIEPMKALYYE